MVAGPHPLESTDLNTAAAARRQRSVDEAGLDYVGAALGVASYLITVGSVDSTTEKPEGMYTGTETPPADSKFGLR